MMLFAMFERIREWFCSWKKHKTVHVLCSHDIVNIHQVINEYNKRKTKLGELGHPAGNVINLDRVSHIVKRVYIKNNKIYAKIKLMDSPCGKILQELYKAKAQVNYGFRGTGRYECDRVVEYKLDAIDSIQPNMPYEDKL
jgi:hypothetical protein